MKLRCTHNSIRIRVRKSDLAVLDQKQFVKETISFPTQQEFGFVLQSSSEIDQIEARLEGQLLHVLLPLERAQGWINTNQVGLEEHISLSGDASLHILIEKDFPCQDRENEDKTDTFFELTPDQPEAC